MRFLHLAAAAPILILAGSAARAAEPAPPASPTLPATAAPGGTAPTPATPAGEAALTLSQVTELALGSNPSVRAAEQELAQAAARLAQAQGQRRFQASFSSTGSVSNADVIQPPPPHETFGTILNTLTIPIPIGSKSRYAIRQAREQLLAGQAKYQSARLTLTGQANAAYYDVLRRQALLEIARQTLEAAQRQLKDAKSRFQAGDAPELDVLRAQVPVSAAEAGVYQAENSLAIARQTLNSLISRPFDQATQVAEVPAEAALPYSLEDARRLAVEHSPDVRAAQANIRAAEAGVAAARHWRDPTLSLQASDQRSGDKTGFSREDSIQATVTIPLFDGAIGKAQVREAEASLEQARQQAEVTRRTTLVSVGTAFLNAESNRRQIAAARVARDVASTAYDRTVLGYQNGLFPLTDVLAAQNTLNQARIAYAQALYDAASAVSELRNAVGETPR